MKPTVQSILQKHRYDRGRLMDILLEVQKTELCIPDEAVSEIAEGLEISRVDVEQTISFYHFFSRTPVGKYAVYLNNSVVAMMKGRAVVARAFEEAAGIPFNSVTADGTIGLWDTSDIGMNDQEPAAIINDVVFTKLTADKAEELVAAFKAGEPVESLVTKFGDGQNSNPLVKSMVMNHLKKPGAVIFTDYEVGTAIRKALNMTPEQLIEEVKKANLRGRGGAGFPTGLKWEFCRRSKSEIIYLICNADEGEPGTFKERVILTEKPHQLFEGMILAGYALGATEGVLYLRKEYSYLKAYLENVLDDLRHRNLLKYNIAGKLGFNFDIRIQMGAGAYVCGEESALIESMEGKRGEPRNRPPFPVQKGYKLMPTVINNVETLSSVVKIVIYGADWFKAIGSRESTGTKVLSISGDCTNPGIYEIEWGTSVNQILQMAGAENVQAVQVGGPSGICINPSQFDRKIAFEDLATGGSFIVIGQQRDILKDIVMNFMNFFIEESCSSCAPCRWLTVILRNTLQRILDGNGIEKDVNDLLKYGKMMKQINRCGLGQTASNPLISTIENFRPLYDKLIRHDVEFFSTFDMREAVADSCAHVGRKIIIHEK